jgi:hypothetical protein
VRRHPIHGEPFARGSLLGDTDREVDDLARRVEDVVGASVMRYSTSRSNSGVSLDGEMMVPVDPNSSSERPMNTISRVIGTPGPFERNHRHQLR